MVASPSSGLLRGARSFASSSASRPRLAKLRRDLRKDLISSEGSAAPSFSFSSPPQLEFSKALADVDADRRYTYAIKTYGCQMNLSDTATIRSILSPPISTPNGDLLSLSEVSSEEDADVLLTNTCAIRENAEGKVWQRLRQIRSQDDTTNKNIKKERR